MIELLAGGGLVIAGVLLGRFLPARRRGPKPVKPVQPICGCGHHLSLHDPETKACHGSARGTETAVRDKAGDPVLDSWGYVQTTYEKGPCACRHYTGPEPLPDYYAPEITS